MHVACAEQPSMGGRCPCRTQTLYLRVILNGAVSAGHVMLAPAVAGAAGLQPHHPVRLQPLPPHLERADAVPELTLRPLVSTPVATTSSNTLLRTNMTLKTAFQSPWLRASSKNSSDFASGTALH